MRFFTIPSFRDPFQAHLAWPINLHLVGFILGYTPFALWLMITVPWPFLLGAGLVAVPLGVNLALLAAAKRGRLRPVARWLVAETWLLITLFTLIPGGLGPRCAWGFFIVVFNAGMLLGGLASMLAAVACSLTTLAIAFLARPPSPHPLTFWLINTFFLAVMIYLQYLAGRTVRDSLAATIAGLDERQQAQALLESSERKHREMVNSLPFCVFEADLDGRLRFVNQTGLDWFGYSRSELEAGFNAYQILDASEGEVARESIRRLLSGKDLAYREYRVRRKDGSLFTALIRTRILREKGVPVGLQGSLIDISSRKQVEQEREAVISLLRATLESTADAILVVDLHGRISDFNRRFVEMWRIPEEVLASAWDAQALAFVSSQMADPQGFLDHVRDLYADAMEESFDLLEFKDGRVFERYSRPQLLGGVPVGRVWSFRDISERKRAEREIAAWRQRFESAVTASNQIFYDLEFATGRIQCSGSVKSLLGYEIDETDYAGWQEMIAPEDREEAIRLMDVSIRGGTPFQFEYGFRHEQGHYVRLLDRGFVMHDAAGKPERMIGMLEDITERKRAEKEITTWKRRFESAVTASDQIVYDYDFASGDIQWSGSIALVLGYEPAEMSGGLSRWEELISPRDRDEAVRLLDVAIQSGAPYLAEYGFRHKQGHYVTILDRGISIGDHSGRPERMIGMMQDITVRKQAEQALQESELRYRTLFDSSSDAIFLSRGDAFVDCNARTLEMFGCSREEFAASSADRFTPERQPDGRLSREKAMANVQAALDGQPQQFDWVHRRKDGTPFPAEVILKRVEFNSGTCLFAVVRDVSDRRRLEEQLLQAQKMEAVGILAGGVAHDFNNILSTIVGYATLLQMKAKDTEPLKEYAERILVSTERAVSLTHSLLAFSRKQEVELLPVELNGAISGFHRILARLIGEDIVFRLELAGRDLVVEADVRHLEQVLMNLATNSRDAMPGGGMLTISTALAVLERPEGEIPPGEYALITVRDSGGGMDEQTQRHIYEPFFTTKPQGQGTGLGLAIVYGIIKNHGGFISAESAVGRGTSFSIYLPLKDVKPKRIPRRIAEEAARGAETVLLIEDDAAVRQVTRSVLEEFGYQVIEAIDGESGVETFRRERERVDLVLCDLIMPGKNGREAVSEIRRNRPGVKVIFVSGYAADIIARKGIVGSDEPLLMKPIKPVELLRKVRQVLDS